jgi:hypothetical protein
MFCFESLLIYFSLNEILSFSQLAFQSQSLMWGINQGLKPGPGPEPGTRENLLFFKTGTRTRTHFIWYLETGTGTRTRSWDQNQNQEPEILSSWERKVSQHSKTKTFSQHLLSIIKSQPTDATRLAPHGYCQYKIIINHGFPISPTCRPKISAGNSIHNRGCKIYNLQFVDRGTKLSADRQAIGISNYSIRMVQKVLRGLLFRLSLCSARAIVNERRPLVLLCLTDIQDDP